jgi:hypothetical protein
MSDHEVDIRLVGFAGFAVSERFLSVIDDEISVARWGHSRPRVERRTDLRTAAEIAKELESPCEVTVVSAHAGPWRDPEYFFGSGRNSPLLRFSSIGRIGATSMVIIDACWAEKIFARLRSRASQGTLLVGLEGETRETEGRDSVAVLSNVIRELCYPTTVRLDPEAALNAVKRVNAQVAARNELRNRTRLQPSLTWVEC